jgi:DNA-binding NarL/FixJ family response regulator
LALLQTGDLVSSGYFVHPEDALLCNGGAKQPNVILMDVQQFGSGGIQAIREFSTAFPRVSLLVLTESVEQELIWAALGAGAAG